MLSEAEWKNLRQAGPLPIGNAVVRAIGSAPNLKNFDPDVAAYHQANNQFDRVSILASMLVRLIALHPSPKDALSTNPWDKAISKLLSEVKSDLNQICGVSAQFPRTSDVVSASNHAALAAKTINIDVFYVHPPGALPPLGPVETEIDAHIQAANTVFAPAGIQVQRSNTVVHAICQTAANEPLLAPAGAPKPNCFYLTSTGGDRLITVINASNPAAKRIQVVYVERFDDAQAMAYTFKAGASQNGFTTTHPIVIVSRFRVAATPAAYPYDTNLAHEIGHALTSELNHSVHPRNLMCDATDRIASEITIGQTGWFRNSDWI